MFGHWYRDEFALGTPKKRGQRETRSETTTLWAEIPSKPTFEAYSAESEGRKREKDTAKCKV